MITDKRSILFWVLCTLLVAKNGFRQKMLALKHTDRCVVFFFSFTCIVPSLVNL